MSTRLRVILIRVVTGAVIGAGIGWALELEPLLIAELALGTGLVAGLAAYLRRRA